jgi:hypothetical protein
MKMVMNMWSKMKLKNENYNHESRYDVHEN